MHSIKIAAPAKINLTLEVLNKREDGFHNIKSIMQAISLYDYLTFEIEDSTQTEILLSGNSDKIPYDGKNLVHKAITKFIEKTNIKNKRIKVYIEKNIPVEAGLAGGSTDAAGALVAMNELFNNRLQQNDIEQICASLGSDLNFCLHGGTALCTGRGENIQRIPTQNEFVTLIKPLGFGISAKEAYTKFTKLTKQQNNNYTEKMISAFSPDFLYNSLELAVINDYQELLEIKKAIPQALMSGSGPTFFVLERFCPVQFDSARFLTIEDLHFITDGIKIVN